MNESYYCLRAVKTWLIVVENNDCMREMKIWLIESHYCLREVKTWYVDGDGGEYYYLEMERNFCGFGGGGNSDFG